MPCDPVPATIFSPFPCSSGSGLRQLLCWRAGAKVVGLVDLTRRLKARTFRCAAGPERGKSSILHSGQTASPMTRVRILFSTLRLEEPGTTATPAHVYSTWSATNFYHHLRPRLRRPRLPTRPLRLSLHSCMHSTTTPDGCCISHPLHQRTE